MSSCGCTTQTCGICMNKRPKYDLGYATITLYRDGDTTQMFTKKSYADQCLERAEKAKVGPFHVGHEF